jgi:ribulose-phosphate 3-epimerase
MEIIPAIIPQNFEDLKKKLSLVRGLVPLVQIDILDGVFVPEKSWPFVSEEETQTIPLKDEFDFEFDLMIKDPKNSLDRWINLGAKRIIIHIESTDNLDEIIDELKLKNIKIGIAIDIDTSNEQLKPYLNKIDFVQFMGIAKIGFQGEPFDERVINKIVDLRSVNSDVKISVDGGVNLNNASKLIQAGADRLAAGSAIFKSENIAETIKTFQNQG